MNDRKLITKKSIVFFAVILLVAVLILILLVQSPKGESIVIDVNGEKTEIKLAEISDSEDIYVVGADNIELDISVDKDSARIVKSTCRDQVCVRTGEIKKEGESAVCLPARVSLRITGTDKNDTDSIDGVTY